MALQLLPRGAAALEADARLDVYQQVSVCVCVCVCSCVCVFLLHFNMSL